MPGNVEALRADAPLPQVLSPAPISEIRAAALPAVPVETALHPHATPAIRFAGDAGTAMLLATPELVALSTSASPAWQQVLHSSAMLHKFDEIRQQLVQAQAQRHALIATGIGMTGSLSIGYVVWLIRGGVLVSSMLSALPAWQMVDPLPILAAGRDREEPGVKPKKRRRTPGSNADAQSRGERDVETLFDAKRPDEVGR
ncbi:MAG TPA: hypothetical protein VH328_06935 [Burkholderiaceae bacterium]|nr:hypothetical protein [Burkholderiaceae bacterium]